MRVSVHHAWSHAGVDFHETCCTRGKLTRVCMCVYVRVFVCMGVCKYVMHVSAQALEASSAQAHSALYGDFHPPFPEASLLWVSLRIYR